MHRSMQYEKPVVRDYGKLEELTLGEPGAVGVDGDVGPVGVSVTVIPAP